MVASSPIPNDPSMLCSSSGIEVQRISSDNSTGGGGVGCNGGISSPIKTEVSTPPPASQLTSQPRFSPAYTHPPPPPSHLFNGMLPPISHVDVKPPLPPPPHSSSSASAHIMLSPPLGMAGGDDGSFPPFQQLVSASASEKIFARQLMLWW